MPEGTVDNIDVFLDNAQAATHNALCYEIRRTFALVIASMFERPLRSWLASRGVYGLHEIEHARLPALKEMIEGLTGITSQTMRVADDIDELWSVANAVRHGQGPSVRTMAQEIPSLWFHLPRGVLDRGRRKTVDNMRVTDRDLHRYTLAIIKFWANAGASSIPGV